MERRIMSLGRSSMVISLPKNWMQLNELKKGDVVSFAIQRDRSLVIYPSAQKRITNKEITLRIGQEEEETLIAQKIIGSFLNGYSGITLIAEKIFSIPQRKAIRNISGRLYMRVMESDSKGVYLQTLSDESKASLEQAIQRMHLISYSMCEDVFTSLKNNDIALAKSVFSLDDDVDHFSFFILRLLRNAAQDAALANELRIDPLDCMDHQTLVYRIEHAADYTADIARHIIMLEGSKQKIPDDVLELMVIAGTDAVDLYVKSVNAFFSRDVPFSVEIMKYQQRIEKLDQEIAAKSFTGKHKNAELVCGICSIRDNIKRIADTAANIAEIAVNRAFKVTT
ncbi:phosphate uptake regulator PhoU [Candidatus Bathyarchaeota archaeon]|nr:phosphate uptake regulator PhoU [Candidatus Bathyarchaeota archaeon]